MITMDIKKLRQKILDLAIGGKLVPQDPNDEPASVLLERIRAEKERLIAEGKIKRPKKSKSSSAESHYQQLPDGWAVTRLADIAWFGGGKTPSTENRIFWNNGTINWITSKDMKEPVIIDSKIKLSAIGASQSTIYPKGTLLMVTRSGILRRTLPLAITGKESTVNQDIKTVTTPFYGITEYLYWYFTANESEILEKYQKDGTTVESIDFEKFQNIEVLLPPLAEQERIIKQLKLLLQLIDVISADSNRIKTTIEKTKSKILDLAMQGKLVPQDPADEPAVDMLRRINPKAKIITDNPHSWNIPSSWTWCYLGDIFQHNTGKALNSSNKDGIDYEYITTSNVYWGRFVLGDLNKMPFKENEIEKCTVCKGDLLVCEGGDVGRAAIWNLERNIMIQNHLHRLRPLTNEICTTLYFHVFRLYKDRDLIGGKGIALQGFSSKSLHHLIVPLPPSNEQKRIAIQIEELYSILDVIEASLQS